MNEHECGHDCHHDTLACYQLQIDALRAKLAQYEKALQDIKKHQEIVTNGIGVQMSPTWLIARGALDNKGSK